MVMIQEAVNWDVVSSLVVVSRKTHDVATNPVHECRPQVSVGLWLSRALRAFQVGESCESVEVETCDAQMDMHADLRRTVPPESK